MVAPCEPEKLHSYPVSLFHPNYKKPFICISKQAPGVHGKRSLERGWQKRLAEKVGKGLAKRLAKGWRRVGTGLATFLASSTFALTQSSLNGVSERDF